MRPVYVDGPLLGQRFDTDCGSVHAVQADPADTPLGEAGRRVTYRFRPVRFTSGGTAATVWIGWCGPVEPDAGTICRALFREDVADRMEVTVLPPELSGRAWRCGSCTFEQYGTGPGGGMPPAGTCPECGARSWVPQLPSEEIHG